MVEEDFHKETPTSINTNVRVSPSYRQLGALCRQLLGGPDGVGVQSQATDHGHAQEATPHPHPPNSQPVASLPINHCILLLSFFILCLFAA